MAYSRCIMMPWWGLSPVVTENTIHIGTATYVAWGFLGYTVDGPIISRNVIDGGTASTVYAIELANVATAGGAIRENVIELGAGAGRSYGVSVGASVPVLVEANDFRLGAPAAVGLRVRAGAPMIRNNVLVMSGGSTAIEDESGSEISNNTIVGTSGTGILVKAPGSSIRNNAFDQEGGICIAEEGVTTDPFSIRNNDLFGCPTLYRDEGSVGLVMLADVNGLAGAAANLVQDPQLVGTAYPGESSPLLGAGEDLLDPVRRRQVGSGPHGALDDRRIRAVTRDGPSTSRRRLGSSPGARDPPR